MGIVTHTHHFHLRTGHSWVSCLVEGLWINGTRFTSETSAFSMFILLVNPEWLLIHIIGYRPKGAQLSLLTRWKRPSQRNTPPSTPGTQPPIYLMSPAPAVSFQHLEGLTSLECCSCHASKKLALSWSFSDYILLPLIWETSLGLWNKYDV